MNTPKTHGEAYASNHRGYRDRIDRASQALQPIHDRVAALQAEGLTAEQAWAEVLKHVA